MRKHKQLSLNISWSLAELCSVNTEPRQKQTQRQLCSTIQPSSIKLMLSYAGTY